MLARLIPPLGVLVLGLFFFAANSPAKPDYTRRTKKDCEFCHPPNSRLLNDAGKYYQEHNNSLAGYKPKEPAKDEKPAPAPNKSE
jgi:hypothetical protein